MATLVCRENSDGTRINQNIINAPMNQAKIN